ncbi:MAG: DUF4325 domain-containing protein [Cyanobacteria bacterium J06643_4]
MSTLRNRSEQIRKFVLENLEACPTDIAEVTSSQFNLSSKVTNQHLTQLVEDGLIEAHSALNNRSYELKTLQEWTQQFTITPNLAEDVIWSSKIKPRLKALSVEAFDLWEHGFTEMFNNAIDHSDGKTVDIHLWQSAIATEISLDDDGVGIFKKIQNELQLADERQAALELTKGKFTTAPQRHSGEGIFFTSRMFDSFEILSGGIYFTHENNEDSQWLLDEDRVFPGTTVKMKLSNDTSRSISSVFNDFSSGDQHAFNKTVVPVKLAQYGDSKLVSRSQAKRLLVRFDRFETIVLDFKDVDRVGQAFADEIFRVFQNKHTHIDLQPINTNEAVARMISRALSHR